MISHLQSADARHRQPEACGRVAAAGRALFHTYGTVPAPSLTKTHGQRR